MAMVTIRTIGEKRFHVAEVATASEAIALAERLFKLPKRTWGYGCCVNGRISYGKYAELKDAALLEGDVVCVAPTPSPSGSGPCPITN